MISSLFFLLCSILLISGQNSSTFTRTNSTTSFVPTYYSAPNTFSPTATGLSAILGSTVTITNSGGAVNDTFTYVNAASTVRPYGNVTMTATGGGGGQSNLQPDPTNLQTAAASKNFNVLGSSSDKLIAFIIVSSLVGGGILGGIGTFF